MFYVILEHDRVIPVMKSDKIIIRSPAVICIPLIFQIFLILLFKSVINSIKMLSYRQPLTDYSTVPHTACFSNMV